MTEAIQPGDVVAGKYRIDRVLGRGGMGTVVAATNVVIDQPVALKFLLPEMASEPAVVARLMREARASARLRSEHVCLVYDVGNERGLPFIVMELLEGHDLASMVGTRRALPVSLAVDYVMQAMAGLAEAHALGIVHRDLKPANLFLTQRRDGSALVKVLDFGIAKAPADRQMHLTRTATVMGSPGYMSPEQLRSTRDVDARSDIWALGVILFELCAGKPPFIAESITELTLRVAMDPTPALPGVPAAFERVVARCLEKTPAKRFRDVGQLAEALAPFASKRGDALVATIVGMLRAQPAVTGPLASAPGQADRATTTLGSSASAMMAVPRRRAWGAVAFALLASMGLTYLVMRPGARASVAPAAPGSNLPSPPSAPVATPRAATLPSADPPSATPSSAAPPSAAPPAPAPVAAPPVTAPPPAVPSRAPASVAPAWPAPEKRVRRRASPPAAPPRAAPAAQPEPDDVGASRE